MHQKGEYLNVQKSFWNDKWKILFLNKKNKIQMSKLEIKMVIGIKN